MLKKLKKYQSKQDSTTSGNVTSPKWEQWAIEERNATNPKNRPSTEEMKRAWNAKERKATNPNNPNRTKIENFKKGGSIKRKSKSKKK